MSASGIPAVCWRQILWITLGAVALYILVRQLPTGTNLSHMDFRPGGTSVEFCDPANPQFLPVSEVRSPVEMKIAGGEVTDGHMTRLTVSLRTVTGKPIGPGDLLVVHTQKLHLMLIDPTLTDYQHLHPQPGAKTGDWVVDFTPRRAGRYRVFADFTPSATGRGLYAGVDLDVKTDGGRDPELPHPEAAGLVVVAESYRFDLVPGTLPVRAGKQVDLGFSVARDDGAAFTLAPVMGAFAHLVAFDRGRSGFAHLHPGETDLSRPLDAKTPHLSFKVTLPKPGSYVVWAQTKPDGRELAVPFLLEVMP